MMKSECGQLTKSLREKQILVTPESSATTTPLRQHHTFSCCRFLNKKKLYNSKFILKLKKKHFKFYFKLKLQAAVCNKIQ